MSRIGKKPVSIAPQTTVTVVDNQVMVKGPKGQLNLDIPAKIKVEVKDNQVMVSRADDLKATKALHGLVRSLIQNYIIGVTESYKKSLKLLGTGYRVQAKGANLVLSVGFSHPVEVKAPEGIKLSAQGTDIIVIEGIDKQLVGQVAADIRAIRPPEPYKGKGIRYEDEVVKLKPGKAAA